MLSTSKDEMKEYKATMKQAAKSASPSKNNKANSEKKPRQRPV
jgi:hypothetical protein